MISRMIAALAVAGAVCALAGPLAAQSKYTVPGPDGSQVTVNPQAQVNPNNGAPCYVGNTGCPAPANNSQPATASVAFSISAAITTQLVAAVAGKLIYVSALDVVSNGTNNLTFEYGTGTNCVTGTTALNGPYGLLVGSGLVKGNGSAAFWFVPTGNALCALTATATQVNGSLSYAQP